MIRAAALLAFLATGAQAAGVTGADCLPLAGVGCYFVPENAPADSQLLVYLRGHHPNPQYGPNVPPGQFLASARQAFEAYELGRIAQENKVVVLVTYRSGLGVTNEDLAALAARTKRTFSRTILAAHSGGYVGLGRTLDAGVVPSRFVMLDNFYGGVADGLPVKLQRFISAGTGCAGFYTPHNKKNYDDAFKNGVACPIDALKSDAQHNDAVGRCLGGYLDGRSCL